jgi:2-hydroxy-6-oxo-6-(2'-aminophenyl)hexa-2,4-dienoate hydrolase
MKYAYPSQFIDAGGVRTHYLEAGSGAPLVLIHGGGAGADGYTNWMKVMPMFAKAWRVIAVDMLGFGQTGKPDGDFLYSQGARNKHLADFLRAMKLEHPAVVGNSMGGATAIGVAVEHPGLIGKLVLMGSAGLNAKLTEALMPVINYDYTREGMVKLIRALTTPDFVIDDALVDHRHKASVDPDTRRAYGLTMKWVKEQHGLYYADEFLGRIRQPTLVVNGKNDKVVPLENAVKFLELIALSWGYVIPNCGHWVMLEQPDEFYAATSNFLSARR